MPGSWDPEVYKNRARQWKEAAEAQPPGPTRDAYLVIADGYANLAALIERNNSTRL
jgi:hypothetical protein